MNYALKHKIIGIIPARYESSRFPGKPLAMINGKSMIQRVYEQASAAKCLSAVYVATDDNRIAEHLKASGIQYIMTSRDHQSGTDRCYEASKSIATLNHSDYIINIQGDEPFIHPDQIDELGLLCDGTIEIATQIGHFKNLDELKSSNTAKVVFDAHGFALYFSRSVIPAHRSLDEQHWIGSGNFHKHIGIYAYRADVLQKIAALPPGKLELTESLEQLRWLENGFSIKLGMTKHSPVSIDTPEDLQKALALLS
jgi:3-deoxy-manno-octulosonate cytidylyltransferase (CMP-KDO synthetase)